MPALAVLVFPGSSTALWWMWRLSSRSHTSTAHFQTRSTHPRPSCTRVRRQPP